MNGWIKLHRKLLNNEFLIHDPNAKNVFITLLLLANRDGKGSFGRKILSHYTGLKEITAYKAFLRLKNANLVTQNSNNKFTQFSICKWHEYQGVDDNVGNNEVTTREQRGNTLQEYRIKKEEKDTQTADAVLRVYRFYVDTLKRNPNTYKLTDTRKQQIKRRLKDAGEEMLLKAITNLSKSKWHIENNQVHLELVIRSYEQVEKFANMDDKPVKESLVQKLLRQEREKHELKINQ